MLFRIAQARLLGAEILIHIQAGKCQPVFGQITAAKRSMIEETCELNGIQNGWIMVLSKPTHVDLRCFGEVQKIRQALINAIYL